MLPVAVLTQLPNHADNAKEVARRIGMNDLVGFRASGRIIRLKDVTSCRSKLSTQRQPTLPQLFHTQTGS
jgi:hypothetical protein